MAQMNGTCTPELFWTCVAEIGWQDPTVSYRKVQDRLQSEWDNEFLSGFRAQMTEAREKLSTVVEDFERQHDVSCECGDDSFRDLLNHVIGLGKEEYEAALKDPMRVVKRGQKGKYRESFSYCIPFLPPTNAIPMTAEEAWARVSRDKDEKVARGADPKKLEHLLEMQALELMLGEEAHQSPRYYAAWAKALLPDIRALWLSDFAGELAPELLNLLTVVDRVSQGDMAAMFENPDLHEKIARFDEKRKEIHAREMKRLELLTQPGCHLGAWASNLREHLSSEDAA